MIKFRELKEGMMIRRIIKSNKLFTEGRTHTVFYDNDLNKLCIMDDTEEAYSIKSLAPNFWELVEESLEQKIEKFEEELEALKKQVEEQKEQETQIMVTQGSIVEYQGSRLLVTRMGDNELGLITIDTGNYWVRNTVPRKLSDDQNISEYWYTARSFPITELDEDLTADVTTLIKF